MLPSEALGLSTKGSISGRSASSLPTVRIFPGDGGSLPREDVHGAEVHLVGIDPEEIRRKHDGRSGA